MSQMKMMIIRCSVYLLCLLCLKACAGFDREALPHFAIEAKDSSSYAQKQEGTLLLEYRGLRQEVPLVFWERGNFSRRFPKTSWSIRSEKALQIQDLPPSKRWILNASYIDKTFMRHRLCFELFAAMRPNENKSLACRFIELSLNGKEQGLYLLQQWPKAKYFGINTKDTTSFLFKEPPLFFEQLDSASFPEDNIYGQRFPDKSKRNCSPQMEALRQFLFATSDEIFRDSFAIVFDRANIIDWHLLLLLSNNSDGILKNFFLYKKNAYTGLRFAPWDYDHSFGRDGDNELNMMRQELDCNRSVLFRRLNSWPRYRQRLQERYQELRTRKIFSLEELFARIDAYTRELEKQIPRNQKIWPIDAKYYFDANSFAEEVQLLKNFIQVRIAQLDEQFGYTS